VTAVEKDNILATHAVGLIDSTLLVDHCCKKIYVGGTGDRGKSRPHLCFVSDEQTRELPR